MSRPGRLTVVLVLNLVLVAGLVAVGLSAHSLGVLAEGADCLADAAAIGVSLLAIWLSRQPPTAARPDGYPEATLWAALVNSGWLLILSGLVIAGAIDRLTAGTAAVQGLPVLVVSGIAAVVMLAGALVLGGDIDDSDDDDGDLNMQAVLLDTATAAGVAVAGVAVAGAIILATRGLYWLDPAVALAISAVVACHAIQLLRRVAAALRSSGHHTRRARPPENPLTGPVPGAGRLRGPGASRRFLSVALPGESMTCDVASRVWPGWSLTRCSAVASRESIQSVRPSATCPARHHGWASPGRWRSSVRSRVRPTRAARSRRAPPR